MNMKAIFAVMNATLAVVKMSPEKIKFRTLRDDLCDTDVMRYQISKQPGYLRLLH